MMIVIITWNVEHPWNVLAPFHHKTPSQHPNLLIGMQNDPMITKDVPPPCIDISVPDVDATTKTKKGVGGEI